MDMGFWTWLEKLEDAIFPILMTAPAVTPSTPMPSDAQTLPRRPAPEVWQQLVLPGLLDSVPLAAQSVAQSMMLHDQAHQVAMQQHQLSAEVFQHQAEESVNNVHDDFGTAPFDDFTDNVPYVGSDPIGADAFFGHAGSDPFFGSDPFAGGSAGHDPFGGSGHFGGSPFGW